MNKRFEAVPVEDWKKQPQKRGYYSCININGDISRFWYELINGSLTGESVFDVATHVLVPIEEQSISPEFAQKLFDAFRLYAHDEYGVFVSDYIIQDFIKFHLPTSPKDTEQTKPLDK